MPIFIARLPLYGAIFCTVIALLSGCSSAKNKPVGTDLKLNFIVEGNINPDENKRPSPVFVRLYELKSPTIFNKADFIDLYERDKEILGSDLLAKQMLRPLPPGVTRSEKLVLTSGATQIGLYVEFSQYRGSAYKATFPIILNSVGKNEVTIRISGNEISFVKKQEAPKNNED